MTNSNAEAHQAEELGNLADTGDFLAVSEDQQLDHDDHVADEINPDEFKTDFSDVPEGEHVELSTASLDEDA